MILFLLFISLVLNFIHLNFYINACILQMFVKSSPVLRILVVTEHCPHSMGTQCQILIVDVVSKNYTSDLWTCSSGTSIFFIFAHDELV